MARTKSKAKSPKKPHLSVAVEPEEMESYERCAAKDGRTLSSWVRFTLNRAAASK